MIWIIGIFGIFVLIAVGFIIASVDHRKRARASDDPIGSIWYHIKQSSREDEEKWLKKKAAKKEAAIAKKNAKISLLESQKIPKINAAHAASIPSKPIKQQSSISAKKNALAQSPFNIASNIHLPDKPRKIKKRINQARERCSFDAN